MKFVLLSTDTYHHWYFINKLKEFNIYFDQIIFETSSVKPLFKTEPFFTKETHLFEENRWGKFLNKSQKVFLVNNVNDIKTQEEIKKINPDVGLTFGTRKLKTSTINLFSKYILNIHRGITQKYRGLDSEFWAIYHNDFKNIGTTLHKIDENLDTGDVIFQDRINFKNVKHICNLRALTTEIALKQTVNFFNTYKKKKIKFHKQKKIGRYYSFMPLDLKNTLEIKFHNYIEKINEQ